MGRLTNRISKIEAMIEASQPCSDLLTLQRALDRMDLAEVELIAACDTTPEAEWPDEQRKAVHRMLTLASDNVPYNEKE